MPNINALGLIVSEEMIFKDFPAKNFKPMGRSQFRPGGHNLKESERGPPKEHFCKICLVVSEKKFFKDFSYEKLISPRAGPVWALGL